MGIPAMGSRAVMGAVMDNIVEENGTLSIGRHSKGDWIVKMKPGLFLDESSIVNHYTGACPLSSTKPILVP